MSGAAKIEWADAVWDPFKRGQLDQPLRWRKARRVSLRFDLFDDSMSDLFIDQVFAVMALAPQHTFIVLTKRPKRMQDYLTTEGCRLRVVAAGELIAPSRPPRHWYYVSDWSSRTNPWPLPHVQLGVSVENQETADERIPLLLQTPATKRIVSYEPALGPVKWASIRWETEGSGGPAFVDVLGGTFCTLGGSGMKGPKLDGVIVGGEIGPKARPCDVAWIRSTVQQCKAAGVACCVKQLGSTSGSWAYPTAVTEAEAKAWMRDGWCRVTTSDGTFWSKPLRLKDRKGADLDEWPEDLRVREVV